jgi:hypothetical protein
MAGKTGKREAEHGKGRVTGKGRKTEKRADTGKRKEGRKI